MRFINTLSNIWTLLVIGNQYCTAFVVNAVIRIVVTNFTQGIASNLDVVNVCIGSNLTSKYY